MCGIHLGAEERRSCVVPAGDGEVSGGRGMGIGTGKPSSNFGCEMTPGGKEDSQI